MRVRPRTYIVLLIHMWHIYTFSINMPFFCNNHTRIIYAINKKTRQGRGVLTRSVLFRSAVCGRYAVN